MSLLSMLEDASDELGIPRPTSVIGNAEDSARLLLALANREGKSLCQRYPWQECRREATHTTLAAELQGTLEAIAPGFNWDLLDTFWNRTQQVPIGGALTPNEWQLFKSSVTTGPYSDFYIRQKNLYMIPAPVAGETIAFEFASRYWCQSSGGAAQERWVADTDTGILPEDIMTIGVVWRYKKAKELDYAEEFREYEMQVNNRMARSGGARILDMTGSAKDYMPGILVPQGNWSP